MNKRKVRITNTGYLPNSPDRNNDMNIIPSNQITMKKVPFPIMGIDNLGNQQMMMPGMNYTFPGQYVTEIPLGKYQKGGLIKYQGDQGPSQVVSAGTDEMWVPLDNMTSEESKQWASLRGDALPYIGKQASNQGIYKAYDFAKSQGMDYNQYLDWLKTSSEQKEKSKPRKSLQLPVQSDIIQGSDATSNIKYLDMPYEMAEYYSKLPNSPIGQDPNTGDFIYLGKPDRFASYDNKYEYFYPSFIRGGYEDPKELEKYIKSLVINQIKLDKTDETSLNKLENISANEMTKYIFDQSPDAKDTPEIAYIKRQVGVGNWTGDPDFGKPLVIPAYETDAEARGAKAKYHYIKESMNSPLAKFLGAEPGKVNPNVAKRAEIHGYDVAAENALKDMSSILGLSRVRGNYDTEGIRHILQNPDAFNKQLSSIINGPFSVGTVSIDVTGSNRFNNLNISRAEAEKLSNYINIIQRSPKFSYMSEATPQDKFIQGTGLGWFIPTSEAAKNANLLDAVGAPFELPGNILGNYINDIFQPDLQKTGELFGNEFPTATPQPLVYSLTDPAGAAFISSLYKTGLDAGGSELGLKMLSGINSIGRSIANTTKDVVSYPRLSTSMGHFRPSSITDEYAANELSKLDEIRYSGFGENTRPFTKLFTTNKQLKKSPLNPKVNIISEIDRNGVPKIGNVEELERVVTHPNSGLTPSEMMLFNEVKSGEGLTNQQIAAFYKAQLNQYGATRVAPETLSWQQRLKNSVPFTKKTDTFYDSSKIKRGRTDAHDDFINSFNINNPNRAFTKEEYDIQKRLFDISGKTKHDYSRGTIDWSLGNDIRNNMTPGSRSYIGAAGLVGTGLTGTIAGAFIDRNTDIKYDYIDPYLNPILKKLGINIASDSKAPSENLSIELSEPGSELSSVRVNQQELPEDFNIIIGGEFIYNNPNTVQTAEFYTKNPDFKVGDKQFRAAESNAFYGIEDGKLKAGKPEEFKPETVIVPTMPANKNDFTPIKEAGISENGVIRLLDANNQPIYQTAGSSGKLLLYSPNTGKSYFIYNSGNDLKDVAVKINNIIAKDPDVRSVTIDNGRYDHYIENKEGLTKNDFERYYEADLQNPGSPGFNLVFKHPKKQQYGGLIKAQRGLKVPTAADSLDVLNSSLAAERFYQGQKYNVTSTSPYFKSPNDFKNELDTAYKNYINKLNSDQILDLSSNILVSSQHSPYAPNDYYRDVQKPGSFRIRQKEQASGTLNPKAPKITYDTRIVPQKFKVYMSFPDSAGIFTYDKLATTPWSKLSLEQKKQRLKQFGVSGTPYKNVNEGLKKLNSTPIKSTTNTNDNSELTYIKPKDISRIPVSKPELIPIPYNNFETNAYQKKEPIYRMNYGQHKGQVQIGENIWDDTTKRWKRRMFEPEEIEYLLKKDAIEISEQKPLKKSSQGVMRFKDGGIYLGKYMFKNGGLVKYQDKGQVSFDDYMMQGLRPQGAVQESTYRPVPIIEQVKKEDVKGITPKQKVQTAANRKKIVEEEKRQQFEAELANQGEIKPAPSEFDSNVAKAYYIASNPMSALGHYARYGYIPQGNVGNYGLRYDQSPMEMIANSVNPVAWANAAYRFTNDLMDKDTYTTLGGAGNALFDALEATPMLGAMRSGVPSMLQDVNLAKSLANNKINQGISYLESKEGVFGRSPKLTSIPESKTLGAPEMSRLADIESGMALQSSRLDPYQKLKKKIEFIESKPNLAEDDVVRMFGKSRKDLYDEFDVMESNRGNSIEMTPPGTDRVSSLNLERPPRSQASRDAQIARRANRQQNTQTRELNNMFQEDPETFQQVLNELPAYQRRNIQLDTSTEGLPRIEIPETFANLDMAAIRNLMNAAVQKPTIPRATDVVKGLFNSNPTYKGQVEKFMPSFHATDYATPRQMLMDVKSKLDQGLKGLKVGDVGTGSTNTSHNSYLNQMDFIAQNAGKQGLSKPVFLGYEQMNPMGYLSNAAIPDDEIFKYINTKLNQIQQKRGINFNLGQNAPYINEAGSIMIPQYGIRKLNDSFTKIKKRDGGLVKAQKGLELSQPIDRIPKSWKEKYDWTDNVENEYIKFKNDPNAPDNLRFTDDLNDYNVRGMWDSLDRPSNWEQALALYKDLNGEEWIPEEDGYYHAWSQHPGTGEWLKPKHHSTAWMNFAGYPMDPYSRVVVNPEGFFGTETLQTEYKQKGGSVRKVKIKTLPRKNQ